MSKTVLWIEIDVQEAIDHAREMKAEGSDLTVTINGMAIEVDTYDIATGG